MNGDSPERESLRTKDEVVCLACGYAGDIGTFDPCFSIFSDIRCPRCSSTHNQHNSDYQDRVTAAMRGEAGV